MIQEGKLEQQFFDYLHSERNYSVNTSTAYENDLLDFRRFLNEQAITTYQQVTFLDVRIYLTELKQKSFSRTTVARKKFSSLRSFLHFSF